jgi:hypothetical protein
VEKASMHLSRRNDISYVLPSEILKEAEGKKDDLPLVETGNPAGNRPFIHPLMTGLQQSASRALYFIIRKIQERGKNLFGQPSSEEACSVFFKTLARIEETL